MKVSTIEQTVFFNATPLSVYNLIMDAEKHSEFSGSEVEMSTEINGTFKVFDGYCHGYNIELIKGQKIVQAWHFAEEGWPDDHYSICTFEFIPDGNTTRLHFTQTDIPDHKADALRAGWNEFYWDPMKSYLN